MPRKSKAYLKEVRKENTIDDLKRIKKYADSLIKIYQQKDKLDYITKQNIITLFEKVEKIYGVEIDKELAYQKSIGKKFLSDDEIDKIIKNVFDDEK